MWGIPRLGGHRKVILLFLLMVVVPAVVFSVLIIGAIRGERTQAVHQKVERQRQIVRLVEADLNDWLFTTRPAAAVSKALFRFQLEGDRIVFPELQLELPAGGSPPPRPTVPPPRGEGVTAGVITDFYYPRLLIFLRDFKSSAQYFLRLGSLTVLLPGRDRGYVIEAKPVLDHVNQRLTELCAAEDFNGALSIGDLRETRSPATDTFGLDGFSFFQVVFHDVPTPNGADLRQHLFGYSMALLVLVTMLGSTLVYRTVSEEARLSRLRNDFVSAVSHEFRSPLSSILALAERLESARVRDPEKLAEYHRVIGQEARRLSTLVTRLLDFAQIEEGKRIYSLERVELVAVTREAIQTCRGTMRQQRIRICGEDAAPLWVRADRTALQHCIQNLIENAVKYSPPDAPVTVTCGSANGSSVVEVTDRGIGIPPEEQERIFEKFYRGRQAAELNAQGVGIGLALVRHVMERHEGTVSVTSRPGEGSCFRIQLPRAEA